MVVDDHELFRRGIIELLEERYIQVVAEVATAAEAIRRAPKYSPTSCSWT